MNVICKARVESPCYDTPATNVAKKGVEMTAINYLSLKNFSGKCAPQGYVLIKLSASFSKLYSINGPVRAEQLIFFTHNFLSFAEQNNDFKTYAEEELVMLLHSFDCLLLC